MDDNDQERGKRPRACDICRKHKIRCSPAVIKDEPCARCTRLNLECTFQQESKKRAPPKGYVAFLEERCDKLQRLARRLSPTIDLDAEVGPNYNQETWADAPEAKSREHMPGRRPARLVQSQSTASPSSGSPATPADMAELPPITALFAEPSRYKDLDVNDSNYLRKRIDTELDSLHIEGELGNRFHGSSSGLDLVKAALGLKGGVARDDEELLKPRLHNSARPKFWMPPPWKQAFKQQTVAIDVTWPEEDLAPTLIQAFFTKAGLMLPIIHRPTFEQNLRDGLHTTELGFAKLTLLVFAMGSRFVDDVRVCVAGNDGEPDFSSAGWKYFVQVTKLQEPMFQPSSLSNLQTYVIACLFLQFIGAPHVAWLLTGFGIRFATDIGLHREKVYPPHLPLQGQYWKRTFWALVGIDIMISARFGRPCAIALDEIDASLPLEKDDQYYDEITRKWEQPADKPALVSGFVYWIKSEIIVAKTLQKIYNVPDPTDSAIAEMDMILTQYLEEIPPHLRWDINKKDFVHLQQAAVIRLSFLSNRIMVHRRFLPAMFQQGVVTPQAAASLTICTAAAQASVRVLECLKLFQNRALPMAGFAFGAATILLLGIWSMRKRNPTSVDISLYMEDVEKCKDVLRGAEDRWHTAGRLLDVLSELTALQDPEKSPSSSSTRKRGRDDAEEEDEDDELNPPSRWKPAPLGSSYSDTPSFSATSASVATSAQRPSGPSLTLIPGMPDLSAIQWHPGQTNTGFGGPQFDFPSINGYMGSAGGYQPEGVALPSDTWQNLFGDLGNTYSNGLQPPPHQATDEAGTVGSFDWANELAMLGLNPHTHPSGSNL